MSVRSQQYEQDVADNINGTTDKVFAERPKVNNSYSDIRLSHQDNTHWIEVKMNIHDNLINPRLSYANKTWFASNTYSTPATDALLKHLNSCSDASNWITELNRFAGKRNLSLHSTKSDRLSDKHSIDFNMLNEFLATRQNKNICVMQDIKVSDIASLHYIHGKAERVDYLSLGDNFYSFSKHNPLNVRDIKQFDATGVFTLRIVASASKRNYEIQASLKVKGSIRPSDYSIMPGSFKLNPFHYMEP